MDLPMDLPMVFQPVQKHTQATAIGTRTAEIVLEVTERSLTVSEQVTWSLRVPSGLILQNGMGPAMCH